MGIATGSGWSGLSIVSMWLLWSGAHLCGLMHSNWSCLRTHVWILGWPTRSTRYDAANIWGLVYDPMSANQSITTTVGFPLFIFASIYGRLFFWYEATTCKRRRWMGWKAGMQTLKSFTKYFYVKPQNLIKAMWSVNSCWYIPLYWNWVARNRRRWKACPWKY